MPMERQVDTGGFTLDVDDAADNFDVPANTMATILEAGRHQNGTITDRMDDIAMAQNVAKQEN
eukprot:3794562-Pyramimonas_sp.AAC.1